MRLGPPDGVIFTYHKGGSTETTSYASASAIKWVTSAVILRLVEEGVLELDAHPQQYLDWWTSDPMDDRSQVTIRQLLSFPSGLSGMPFGDGTPDCLEDANTTIDPCAEEIYQGTFDFNPGEFYFYGPSHMQILAAIAQAATGESWVDIYQTRVAPAFGYGKYTLQLAQYNQSAIVCWGDINDARFSALCRGDAHQRVLAKHLGRDGERPYS